MTFLPARDGEEPVWNSDTDEVVVTVNGVAAAGAGILVIPVQCTYIIISISDVGSGGGEVLAVTSDATDINSGYYLENNAGGQRNFGFAVVPGTTLYMHTPGSEQMDINVIRFYTKK